MSTTTIEPQGQLMGVLARASSDPAYRARLAADTSAALAELDLHDAELVSLIDEQQSALRDVRERYATDAGFRMRVERDPHAVLVGECHVAEVAVVPLLATLEAPTRVVERAQRALARVDVVRASLVGSALALGLLALLIVLGEIHLGLHFLHNAAVSTNTSCHHNSVVM